MTCEIWKDVPGYEGFYQASTLGRVRRVAPGKSTVCGRVLKGWAQPDGYLRVTLSVDGVALDYSRHVLVLLTFVGPCPPSWEARHLNGVQADCSLSNLKWGTHSENTYDKIAHGTHAVGEKQTFAKLTWDAVDVIRSSGKSNPALAEQFGVHRFTISAVRNYRSWREEQRHGGTL